jgi:hypothetical protein
VVDETSLDERLADLATGSRQGAVPMAAELIRARGDRRRRRKRAARASGGVLLAAAVAVGGISLARAGLPESAPPAADPTPSASAPLFVAPTPAPGEEYARELGYVYDAVDLDGGKVRVTVQQLRDEKGTAVPTGVVHELTLPAVTPVEVERLTGEPGDKLLEDVVGRLRSGPRWVFALDYDGEGRVRSLREAHWLSVE